MTGCHGFVGKNLVDYFHGLGIDVIGLTTNIRENPKILAQLSIDGIWDQGDRLKILKELKEWDCGYLIHLSANLNAEGNINDLIQVNSMLSLEMARLAVDIGIPRFVFISSLTVIGKPKISPINERHPLNPQNNYERTKLIAEFLIRELKRRDTEIDILRIPAPIGRYFPEHRFFHNVIRDIANGVNPKIYSFGNRIQNYLDIRDLGRAIILLKSEPLSDLFLIKGLDQLSNTEAVKKIISITNPSLKVDYSREIDSHDDYNWSIDGSKAHLILNYEPIHGIEEFIKQLWAEVNSNE
jgi:nucleoside-diphosphate-sugar epimerase